MKKRVQLVCSVIMIASLLTSSLIAEADSFKVITLGEDLTEEQEETVMEFFNCDESEVEIVYVNNEEEHEYLDGIVENSVIGTKTLSCCFINPTTEGGIRVKTANLNWVTESQLANALVTAGVENCEIVATAPFEVSGTGALVGVLKAYEVASETELDEDKKLSATEELVLSAELSDENEEEAVLDFMNELKTEAIEGTLGEDSVETLADKYGITLGEELKAELDEWLETFQSLSYDLEQFTESINSLNQTITNATSETKGFFAKIAELFKKFFAWLTGKEYVEEVKEVGSDFFSQFDTSVFSFDSDEEVTVGDSE